MKKIKPHIEKNILDLEYSKFLQYNTVIIIFMYTFVIGIIIALVTKQIDLNDKTQFLNAIGLSSIIFGVGSVSYLKLKEGMKRIQKEIKNLA